MKRSKEILIFAVALAAALIIPNVNAAQDKGEGKGPRGPRGGQMVERMAEELGLSAEQTAKVKAIHEAARPQMEAIRNDASLSREQKREKSQAIQKDTEAKVDAVLTPEQQAKAKEMRAKLRERMKERRGPKGGEGGPEHDGPPPAKGN